MSGFVQRNNTCSGIACIRFLSWYICICYPHIHTTASVSSRSESPDTIPKPNFIKQLLTSPKSRRKKEQQQQKQQQAMQRHMPEDLYTLPDKLPQESKHGKLAVEAAVGCKEGEGRKEKGGWEGEREERWRDQPN